MLDKLTDSMQFSASALELRAKRQEVLTSNISNADTPNYKAVDFKFADALKSMTEKAGGLGTSSSGGMATTHAGHIGNVSGNASMSTEAMLKFRRGGQAALDNNTVDIERERAAFAENTVKYEAALRNINGRLSALKQAMDAQR